MPSLKKRSATRTRAPREAPKDIFPEDDVILSDVADEDVDQISFDPDNDEGDEYSNVLKLNLPDQEEGSSKKKSKKKKKGVDEEYWGYSKKNYYHDQDEQDEADDFDEDIDEAEEEEARRLQAQKINLLKAKDFYDDPAEAKIGDRLANDNLKEVKFEEIKESLQKERKQISEEEAAALPKEKKLELLKADAPELTALLKDVRENVANLRQKIAPLMERVKKGELKSSKGLSYLELKYHLMLSYCINISFYLLLKSEGKSVKDHPVIDTLVRLRTIIDKIRPLDKKLKFQIDKLLKATPTDAQSIGVDEDALKCKPNIKNMYSGSLHAQALAEENAIDTSVGVYEPPRINSLHYDESEAKRERANLEREQQRAVRKKMANFIMQEFSDLPEQVAVDGYTKNEMSKAARLQKENTEFEEANFIRLPKSSKKNKANPKVVDSLTEEFGDLESFGSLNALSSEKMKKDALAQASLQAAKKRSLTQIINEQEKLKKNKKTKVSHGDDDLPVFDPFEIRETHARTMVDEEEETPQERRRRERRELEEEKRRKEQEEDARLDPLSRSVKHVKKTQSDDQFVPKPEPSLEDGTKRKVDRAIKKNRGLVPARKKDAKNPRLKNRNKYEKALQKQKSAGVKTYQPPVAPYAGVAGIKTNISRSVKL